MILIVTKMISRGVATGDVFLPWWVSPGISVCFSYSAAARWCTLICVRGCALVAQICNYIRIFAFVCSFVRARSCLLLVLGHRRGASTCATDDATTRRRTKRTHARIDAGESCASWKKVRNCHASEVCRVCSAGDYALSLCFVGFGGHARGRISIGSHLCSRWTWKMILSHSSLWVGRLRRLRFRLRLCFRRCLS